ncbi:ImmA/IrrE family metallo-endopeptidase [Enterococcus sp. CSURQ0835]|uniref:ImmA/IrrE family metallo-endopeptidase n=1 Tax=Enterococcus sp. CSURQ0835 TaxID=2681394 RepID=UPI001356A5FB|nr:ImmA/IrrE family metallo-endopeptidase [Enterococcus sp. CSURQ0835]
MDDKVSYRLKRKLDELGLDLIFEEMDRSGFYWPAKGAIVVNAKLLKTNDVNFAVAHELSHVLRNHAAYSSLYSSTMTNRLKMEAEANISAIRILVEVYLEENEMDFEQLNSIKFMEYYGIRNSLYFCVEETLSGYTS